MGLKVIPLSGFSATHPSFDKWYSLDRSPDFSGIEVMGEIHLQFEFVATPPKQCSSSLSITYKPKTEEEALEELKNQPWFREDFDRLKAEVFIKNS